MNLFLYGGALFDETPKDFDVILQGDVSVDFLKTHFDEVTFNSFGEIKLKVGNTLIDLAIRVNFDVDVFVEDFVELNSDFAFYDIEKMSIYKSDCFAEYEKSRDVWVINEKSLHPILGVSRRLERIKKASAKKELILCANKHLSSNDDLKYFIRTMKSYKHTQGE